MPAGTARLIHPGTCWVLAPSSLAGPLSSGVRPPVAGCRAGRDAGRCGNPGLREVGGDDLERGEADALQHADAPAPGHHRAADQGGDDQGRQDQPEQREGQDERGTER
jgi:hypothetical protein